MSVMFVSNTFHEQYIIPESKVNTNEATQVHEAATVATSNAPFKN